MKRKVALLVLITFKIVLIEKTPTRAVFDTVRSFVASVTFLGRDRRIAFVQKSL